MNTTELIIIYILGYIFGVIVSLIVTAYINTKDNSEPLIPEGLSVLSWIFIVYVLMVLIIYNVIRPFNWIYEKAKEKFENL